MMGNNSRQRRKFAVKLANKAVYAYEGKEYDDSMNPFTSEREYRIFEKYYKMSLNNYHWQETLHNDMCKAYGVDVDYFTKRDNMKEYLEMVSNLLAHFKETTKLKL